MPMSAAQIHAKLPSDKTPESKAVRSKLFKEFDPNGNGFLSLAEVDRGIQDVLGLEDVFEAKPAIMRAFAAAKAAGKVKSGPGHDFVTRVEFRLLLLYLFKYYELYEKFEIIDSSHDKRLDRKEFKASLVHLEKWGVKISNPDAEFDAIDENKGGYILFDEFAHWGLKKHLDEEDDDH